MTRTILPLWVLLGSVGVCLSDEPKAAAKYSDFAEILDDLKSRDGALKTAAVRRLQTFGALGLAPIRRDLRTADVGEHRQTLTEQLSTLKKQRWVVNRSRAAGWSEAGRIDLLTELLSTGEGPDRASVLKHLFEFNQASGKKLYELVADTFQAVRPRPPRGAPPRAPIGSP